LWLRPKSLKKTTGKVITKNKATYIPFIYNARFLERNKEEKASHGTCLFLFCGRIHESDSIPFKENRARGLHHEGRRARQLLEHPHLLRQRSIPSPKAKLM
jgi:hypothetical protein